MADERVCHAGDLMSDMLGKTIATKSVKGLEVQGVLRGIVHEFGRGDTNTKVVSVKVGDGYGYVPLHEHTRVEVSA